jgi:hypothetical protein
MRRALVVAGSAVLLTAGCTVPESAVAGIGVDTQGNPVGYLKVCHEHIDGATVYIDDAHTFGSWESAPSATGFATWSLATPSGTWKVDAPLAKLKPRTTYNLYGWTNDNSSSAAAVSFTLEDLAVMKPGQVRYWAGTSTADGMNDVYSIASEDEFRRTACNVIG